MRTPPTDAATHGWGPSQVLSGLPDLLAVGGDDAPDRHDVLAGVGRRRGEHSVARAGLLVLVDAGAELAVVLVHRDLAVEEESATVGVAEDADLGHSGHAVDDEVVVACLHHPGLEGG